jgi:hypothetical protein
VDPEKELVAVTVIQHNGGHQLVPIVPAFEDAIY